MNRNIENRHNDTINNVTISDPDIFASVEYTLDNMEYHFNKNITDKAFTNDLVNAYERMVHTYDLPIDEIDDGFNIAIKEARGNINELNFDNIYVFDNVPEIDVIQEKIANHIYQYEESKSKQNPILSISKQSETKGRERN